ncbi:polysaccharide deacetylase family protein [Enterococcus faecium]
MTVKKKLFGGLIILLGVLILEGIFFSSVFNARQGEASETVSSHQIKEKNKKRLKESNNLKSSSHKGIKSVALTFDDGPNINTTPQLLQILKSKNVPATFFVLGKNVEEYPEIVKEAANEGHEIGNHSYNHENLASLSPDEIRNSIKKTDNEIKKVIGKKAKFVRPPYGAITSIGAELINRPIIQWSVDSEDWKTRDPSSILQKVQTTVYDGSIILFHDIYPETLSIIPQVIDYLKSQGYQFETVSKLLDSPTVVENYYGKGDNRPVE